ncbi:hypothetical protein L873DRAFT_1803711 [Choiromyces venosus 120613-1]|uniref:Uncharacterized protein n=1 Tax=Choiromyces venosus 120613-1 TaxID=1336337 RepID=A0A3N4IXU9_9PEZI|nr:hypothetical protein L873DRAFT_1822213 [Choiromyces venosus 120613-1]RPB01255.1 hypothetical protein L873DRAFT_1803711 [Choiromyces venosus 120613-1]
MEERWYQRYDKREKELEAECYDRLLESHEVWSRRWEQQHKQIREKSYEIERLIARLCMKKMGV